MAELRKSSKRFHQLVRALRTHNSIKSKTNDNSRINESAKKLLVAAEEQPKSAPLVKIAYQMLIEKLEEFIFILQSEHEKDTPKVSFFMQGVIEDANI
jgi:hypothetical protein